jgi:sugar O-acyltransferase (sialic acid O-acetyltransferase NeuD family)
MSQPKKLIIVGTSLFGEIAHEYFTNDSPYEVVAFSVERDYVTADAFRGLPVIPLEDLANTCDPAEHSAYVACTYVQLNGLRARLAQVVKDQGFSLASYVSSRAFVAESASIGEHCFIFEDNTIQPFVSIGDNCVLWSGNHIGHHTIVEDDVFVSSHVVISGSVTVGARSFLGVNATIVNDIVIGRFNWLGPGVIITRTTEDDAVWRAPRSEQRKGSAREIFGG